MLGITFRELTPELCKEKEITDLTEGIYVVKVQDQSAAMEADIKEGDIIEAYVMEEVKRWKKVL